MKIWTLLVMMVLIFAAGERGKSEEKGKMDAGFFIPSEVEGWRWDSKALKYNSRTLFDYMNGAAELYLSYGFKNLLVYRMMKAGHPPLTLELYEMASSEDAFGVFSFDRQDDPIGIGQGSEFGGGMLRFWKGKFFISLYAEGEGRDLESAILKMGRAVADSIRKPGTAPKVISFIPDKESGLVEKSVRYLRSHVLLNQRFFIAHQNILNLNRKTEAVLAQYLQDKQKTQLLLIRYPHIKEAREAYQSFMKAYLPESAGKESAKTEDQKWTVARQRNEFVLIIFGSPTLANAEILLKTTEEKISAKL